MDASDAVIPAREADRLLGRSRRSRIRDIADGTLPPTFRVGRRQTGYLLREINAIIAARAGGAVDDELRTLTTRLIDERERRAEALGVGPSHQAAEGNHAL